MLIITVTKAEEYQQRIANLKLLIMDESLEEKDRTAIIIELKNLMNEFLDFMDQLPDV